MDVACSHEIGVIDILFKLGMHDFKILNQLDNMLSVFYLNVNLGLN